MTDRIKLNWQTLGFRAQAFQRAVAGLSFDSVIVVDERGLIRYRSPSTARLLGYDDEEVLGRHYLEFPHPYDRARVRRTYRHVARMPGGGRGVEFRLRRADGTWVWVEARFTNLLHDSAVRGVVVNTVLIDERKTLELRHAAAKLDSHFLYNVLHSIAGLVREERAAEAVEALERVRGLTEGLIGSAQDRWVPLWEEWEWVCDYLELERLRFGPDLVVEMEPLRPAVSDVPVPCRLIQPLVENAVKHGIRGRPGGGRVWLAAETTPSSLVIRVGEAGESARGETVTGLRVGLRTLRERLELHYGDGAEVALETHPRGSEATLTLPVEPAATARVKGA